MPKPNPIHPAAAWLYEPGRATYPDALTQSELMRACLAAANELGVGRPRSRVQRALLAENVAHLLRSVAIREAYGGAPGSMHWDIQHCRRSLADAAAAALEAEYRRSRSRVLRWAIGVAFGDEENPDVHDRGPLLTIEGRKGSVSYWSHQSEAGHVAAISCLDEHHERRLKSEILSTDESVPQQYVPPESHGG